MKAHQGQYPVTTLCQTLAVSKAGYYRWLGRPKSERQQENETLLVRIRHIHLKSRRTYGSPRVTHALKAEGYFCSENRVARLMRHDRLKAKAKRKFSRYVSSTVVRYPAAPNVVNRAFVAAAPNRLWVSDITFIRTRQGWLYLAAILDVFSRKIVGWACGPEANTALASQALQRALGKRNVGTGIIHHSDQGAQYANHQYQALLQNQGFTTSMSRKGNCYDNAVMESFFHTLKMEHVYWQSYVTRQQAENSLFEFIELFYNAERLHSSLGYKSPADYEKKYA
jgi:transposase InsO family protein